MKKLAKRILGIALACTMVLGLSNTTFAAEPPSVQSEELNLSDTSTPKSGVETWYPGDRRFGAMNLTNYNITPEKTMGASGYLFVYGYYRTTDGRSRAILTTQVRQAYSSTVLCSGTSTEATATGQRTYFSTGVTHVNAGDKIQIYNDISSVTAQPSGSPYRKAYVELYYCFIAD